MKTKKLGALLIASMLMVVSAIPVFATEHPAVAHGGVARDDNYDYSSEHEDFDNTGVMEVEADLSLLSSYVVTLPARVSLTPGAKKVDGSYDATNNYTVGVKGNIMGNQYVTVTPDATFTMTGQTTSVTSTAAVTLNSTTACKWYAAEAYASADDKTTQKQIGTDEFVDATGGITVNLTRADSYKGTENFTFALTAVVAEP